jgi:hypothetical protein
MPSLKNAYVQWDRAAEHIRDLEIIASEVCEIEGKSTVANVKDEVALPVYAKDLFTIVRKANTPIPPRCNILTGEAINCLRSALDYLVANLAELDSGAVQPRTQFPIESTSDGFTGKRNSFLKGINQPHVAIIEGLQPYNGCEWTKDLARLSNLHKHNDLVPVQHDVLYAIHLDPIPRAESEISRYKVNVGFHAVLYIGLDNGLPLIETLKKIELQVSYTLAAFGPEF